MLPLRKSALLLVLALHLVLHPVTHAFRQASTPAVERHLGVALDQVPSGKAEQQCLGCRSITIAAGPDTTPALQHAPQGVVGGPRTGQEHAGAATSHTGRGPPLEL